MVNTSLTNIVRCRIFTTNIDDLKSIGKAHSEFFSEITPATTMVEVKTCSTRNDRRVGSGCHDMY